MLDRTPRPLTDPVDLVEAQLHGIDLLHAARRATEESGRRPNLTARARLDISARLAIRQREVAAMQAWTELGIAWWDGPLTCTVPIRAVIGHSDPLASGLLSDALNACSVDVVCVSDNGADLVGVCTAEQPTLLVLDEQLVLRTGREVAHEVSQLSPYTLVAGYVRQDHAEPLLDAGAAVVFATDVTPADVAAQLADLLGR